MEDMLKQAVARRLWSIVVHCIGSVTESQRRWAVEETCKRTHDMKIYRDSNLEMQYGYECSHNEVFDQRSEQLKQIISYAATDQLEGLLKTFIARRQWKLVVCVLQHKDISGDLIRWTVEEAIAKCPLLHWFLEFCQEDQVDRMLERRVLKGRWEDVTTLLHEIKHETRKSYNLTVGKSCKDLIVDEALKSAPDDKLSRLSELCCEGREDAFMAELLKRKMWSDVWSLIKRFKETSSDLLSPGKPTLSDQSIQQTLLEACEICSHKGFYFSNFVSAVPSGMIDDVLRKLIELGLWDKVSEFLTEKRGNRYRWISPAEGSWKEEEVYGEMTYGQVMWVINQAFAQLSSATEPLKSNTDLSTLSVQRQQTSSQDLSNLREGEVSESTTQEHDTLSKQTPESFDSTEEWKQKNACDEESKKDNVSFRKISEKNDSNKENQEQTKGSEKTEVVDTNLGQDASTRNSSSDSTTAGGIANLDEQDLSEEPLERLFAPKHGYELKDHFKDSPGYAICNVFKHCPRKHRCHFIFKAARGGHIEVVRACMMMNFSPNLAATLAETVSKLTSTSGTKTMWPSVLTDLLTFVHREPSYKPDFTTKKTFIDDSVTAMHTEKTEITAYVLETFMTRYLLEGPRNDELLFEMTCCLPWSVTAQNKALTLYLTNKLYIKKLPERGLKPMLETFDVGDVFRLAHRTHIHEQNRRDVFQVAVDNGKWDLAKQWTDHTLYDDQRWWALEKAYKERQWDFMLLLAEQGLSEVDWKRVYDRLAKCADWKTTLEMFQRGGDVREAREMLLACMQRSKLMQKHSPLQFAKRAGRLWILEFLLAGADMREVQGKLQTSIGSILQEINGIIGDKKQKKDPKLVTKEAGRLRVLHFRLRVFKFLLVDRLFNTVIDEKDWKVVMYRLRKRPTERLFNEVLERALDEKAWYIVQQLVRLGMDKSQSASFFTDTKRTSFLMDTSQRTSFFREMLERGQWSVARELLDIGVDVDVCLESLPLIVSKKQWTLVTRIIDYEVDDSLRQNLMQLAIEQQEGSVVWRCLSNMETKLSLQERKAMIKKAFAEGNWQVVKPLIEFKDDVGISHRDTSMVEAMEQRRWDVVDHCQRNNANIDMKDSQGETALNRAAKKRDWAAVEELVQRGADQSLRDADGDTALHRALGTGFYTGSVASDTTIKRMIEYHAPLNQTNKYGVTPLQLLINLARGECIDHALMWSADLCEGVTTEGKTPLHAVVEAGLWQTMYYLIARGVDPLAETKRGNTALSLAVKNEECGQRMLAECIQLGLSTHQAAITDARCCNTRRQFAHTSCELKSPEDWKECIPRISRLFKTSLDSSPSPVEHAVSEGSRVLLLMLYESGACSYRELFELKSDLPEAFSHRAFYFDPPPCDFDDYGYYYEEDDEYKKNFKKLVTRPELKITETRIQRMRPLIDYMASNPRSLRLSCRLVISHCIKVKGRPRNNVYKLPVLSETMKHYILFPDPGETDSSPIGLKGACRRAILRSMNLLGRRHREIHSLPVLDEKMTNYVLFKDLTDPEFGTEALPWEKELLARRGEVLLSEAEGKELDLQALANLQEQWDKGQDNYTYPEMMSVSA